MLDPWETGTRIHRSNTCSRSRLMSIINQNKFLDVESPLMPSLIEPWACASRLVGEDFNLDQQPHPNVSRGYALPEPAIFTNHHEDGSCQTYFSAMWLKLQLVIMYCIHRHGTLACLRHPNDWHKSWGLNYMVRRS